MSELKKEINQNESKYNLQDYLSLGYIFLLILGVFNQAIYYKFLNVNILEYSSVLDVLISPISIITGELRFALAIVLAVLVGLLYKFILPAFYKRLAKKEKYQSGKNKEKIEKSLEAVKSNSFTIFIVSLMIFSVFVGLGMGKGRKTKDRIDKGEIELSHELVFQDDTSKEVRIVGKNSLYVFYVKKGDKEVSVAPIDGNIKSIKRLKKK